MQVVEITQGAPAGVGSRLAAFIRSSRDAIVEDWALLARQLPSASRLDRAQLIDLVPRLLDRIVGLADALARGESGPDPAEIGARHADARLANGFELVEIVRELAMLRSCLLARIEAANTIFDPREVQLLSNALDAAVSASVARYVYVRDRWLDSLDRVGSATLESRSLEELLGQLLHVFVESNSAIEVASIWLRENDRLRLRAAVGLDPEHVGKLVIAIGDGFAGTIAATRAPLAVRDATNDDLVRMEGVQGLGIRGLFGVPLLEGAELLGVACVGSREMPELSHLDRRLFTAMAARAEAGILHFLLRASTEEHARRQRAIADLGRRVLRHVSLDASLEDAVRTVEDVLGADLVEIAELEPAPRAFTVRAGAGWSGGVVGSARISAEPSTHLGYTLVSDVGVIAEDFARETRFTPGEYVLRHGAVSGLSVVIRTPGPSRGAFGVLAAYSKRPGAFGEDERAFLRSVANLVASMIVRHRGEERVRFIADASRRLSESLELGETLAALAGLCAEHLSDWCAIDLVGDDGTLRRAVAAHRDPKKRELAELLREQPLFPSIEGTPQCVLARGRSVFLSEVSERVLREAARDEEQARMLEELGIRAYLCVPISAGGRVLGTISLGSGDPRRLQSDLDLELAEELGRRAGLAIENARLYRESRDATARREEVLAVVSHDLRNPLNVVHMGATLLAENDGTPESTREQALRILRAARRMERLIQDLLDLGSLERGELALVRSREDPRAVASEAIESLREQAAARGQRLELVANIDRPLDVDRDRLLQVLGNLLSNAVRVTPEGGAIELHVEDAGDRALFSVRDTGPGIAPEELPNLFRRHWRGSGVRYRGTGRGLAIAKGIVEAHGGEIWAESTLGKGATFFFTVPYADQAS